MFGFSHRVAVFGGQVLAVSWAEDELQKYVVLTPFISREIGSVRGRISPARLASSRKA
jgi:hypothetical protein